MAIFCAKLEKTYEKALFHIIMITFAAAISQITEKNRIFPYPSAFGDGSF
jgi:hypothetical protein